MLSNIEYKIESDKDTATISAIINGDNVGYISSRILFNISTSDFEFKRAFTIDDYKNIFGKYDTIVNIDGLIVKKEYRNLGIAKQLMRKSIELMKMKGFNIFYLNACPIGDKELKLDSLINFYTKFGFNIIKEQRYNVIMLLDSTIFK